MPSHLSADRPAAQPPGRGQVDSLITQTRRLKGEVDAVRRHAQDDTADPRGRWQRALCDLALHQLDDLDAHLAQLREGPPAPAPPPPALPPGESLLSRVGSAEWNLLTDEALWSPELHRIVGRDPAAPPLTLDELPSLVHDEDRPRLTLMVTGCLIDARPIDGEFRVVRPDGEVRTVHMMGEPVLDAAGSTTSMWAVLRDVSELRRSQRAVRETRDALPPRRHPAQPEYRPEAEPREATPPPWRGSLRLPRHTSGPLDLAARHLPSPTGSPIGGTWYDSLELADGDTLLGAGGLTAHSPDVTSTLAMTLGALRGMAMSGAGPAQLLTWLDRLLSADDPPTLCSTVCCRYRPATRTLAWAQAGHPAPILFRDGTGRRLDAPDGVLLGTTSGAHGQAEVTLEEGDLLLLHTDGLVPAGGPDTVNRLLDLAPRLVGRGTAQDCLRLVVEEFGGDDREDDASVLVARVTR